MQPPRPTRRHAALAMLTLALAAPLAPAMAAPRYQVVDLGADVTPLDINARGLIVGARVNAANGRVGFRYTRRSGLQDLPDTTEATAVDDSGRIVGNGPLGAVLHDRTGVLPLGPDTRAGGLNGVGQMAGGVYGINPFRPSPLPLNPAVYDIAGDDWQVLDIARVYSRGTQQGVYADIYAMVSVNDAGVAVGRRSRVGLYGSSAIVVEPATGVVSYIPLATGGQAVAINNHGFVVGTTLTYTASSDYAHAFLYDGSAVVDLGRLGQGLTTSAGDINDAGQVVGSAWLSPTLTSEVDPTLYHAFLWENNAMSDLNDSIPARLGWLLTSATAINERGDIVGVGLLNGLPHGFWLRRRR